MNEIIKVNYDNERPTVSAKELHNFLEINTRFNVWFPRMIAYGFSENVDFARLSQKCDTLGGTQEMVDYQLTIDMAKELCMIQRNDKGKEARQYFIEIEKQWNNPEMVMARALKMADNKIKKLELQIEDQKPMVEFAATVTKSCDNILMRDMAKLLCDQNINIGEKRLYKLLRNNGILMDDNTPYQSYVDRGYFYIKENTFNTPYGQKLNKTTLVTPKGQIWMVGKVKEWIGMTNAQK